MPTTMIRVAAGSGPTSATLLADSTEGTSCARVNRPRIFGRKSRTFVTAGNHKGARGESDCLPCRRARRRPLQLGQPSSPLASLVGVAAPGAEPRHNAPPSHVSSPESGRSRRGFSFAGSIATLSWRAVLCNTCSAHTAFAPSPNPSPVTSSCSTMKDACSLRT
jgi:hypothetical protein